MVLSRLAVLVALFVTTNLVTNGFDTIAHSQHRAPAGGAGGAIVVRHENCLKIDVAMLCDGAASRQYIGSSSVRVIR